MYRLLCCDHAAAGFRGFHARLPGRGQPDQRARPSSQPERIMRAGTAAGSGGL